MHNACRQHDDRELAHRAVHIDGRQRLCGFELKPFLQPYLRSAHLARAIAAAVVAGWSHKNVRLVPSDLSPMDDDAFFARAVRATIDDAGNRTESVAELGGMILGAYGTTAEYARYAAAEVSSESEEFETRQNNTRRR